MKRDTLNLFDEIEHLLNTNPAVLGFNPLVEDLRHAFRTSTGYPPRNIIKTGEDTWTVEVAVAGFSPSELQVAVHNNYLLIGGSQTLDEALKEDEMEYIHQGLAKRNFSLQMRLGEHIEVDEENPPMIDNGILTVRLERKIPEAKMPKTYDIFWKGTPSPDIQIKPDTDASEPKNPEA